MKAVEEIHRYQTEIFLSLLASYPDYFFFPSDPNSFFGFNDNNRIIEELKKLKNLEGLSYKTKRKVKKTVKKTILYFENLKLASMHLGQKLFT